MMMMMMMKKKNMMMMMMMIETQQIKMNELKLVLLSQHFSALRLFDCILKTPIPKTYI